jgi:hypothetical protein
MTRPSWTVILTDAGFEALPLVKASLRLKALRKEHAERFGPGEVAQ